MKHWTRWAWLGWGLFALSFFVPVVDTGTSLFGGVLPGWEALTSVLAGHAGWFGFVSGLTNLVVLGTLLTAGVRRPRLVRVLLVLAGGSALFNAWWLVSADPPGDLRAGYYLWWTSFVVLTAALGLRLRRSRSRPVRPEPSRVVALVLAVASAGVPALVNGCAHVHAWDSRSVTELGARKRGHLEFTDGREVDTERLRVRRDAVEWFDPDDRSQHLAELERVRQVTFLSRGRGALEGAGFGVLAGIGFGIFISLTVEDSHGFINLTSEQQGVLAGVLASTAGAALGGVIGAGIGSRETHRRPIGTTRPGGEGDRHAP